MFNILDYSHNLADDSLKIKVVYQLKSGGQLLEDNKFFIKKVYGEKWLHDVKKLYFAIKVENYIIHKEHIYNSVPGHKSIAAKKEALKELRKYLNWALFASPLPSLMECCKWALRIQQQFETVLPSSNNNSYESSKEALREIIDFAKQHDTGALLKKAS